MTFSINKRSDRCYHFTQVDSETFEEKVFAVGFVDYEVFGNNPEKSFQLKAFIQQLQPYHRGQFQEQIDAIEAKDELAARLLNDSDRLFQRLLLNVNEGEVEGGSTT